LDTPTLLFTLLFCCSQSTKHTFNLLTGSPVDDGRCGPCGCFQSVTPPGLEPATFPFPAMASLVSSANSGMVSVLYAYRPFSIEACVSRDTEHVRIICAVKATICVGVAPMVASCVCCCGWWWWWWCALWLEGGGRGGGRAPQSGDHCPFDSFETGKRHTRAVGLNLFKTIEPRQLQGRDTFSHGGVSCNKSN
jgi:hypothetical protein